jgi:threonine aldolase
MASRLTAELAGATDVEVLGHADGNEVFVSVTPERAATWRDAGAEFYASIHGNRRLVRLVTSWATTHEEVDQFVQMASEADLGPIS